ncbi:hypothetical protein J2X54_002801 [Duganella sp. 3397]|uniref:hypothetical protein n=1 Tax=Duganella sp. 3397 TaxID=2817732 RepID=UPI0028605C84|nr:hypothetical protein [Duganella sp. 3397]MDR7050320.1 hypothetical protein [Duganella sp. 3397]
MPLVLFDSNILIDNLEGHGAAVIEIMNYRDATISSISWVAIACKMEHNGRQHFKAFLAGVGIRVVHPDDDIMDRAAVIRGRSLKAPPSCRCWTVLSALLPKLTGVWSSPAIPPILVAKGRWFGFPIKSSTAWP